MHITRLVLIASLLLCTGCMHDASPSIVAPPEQAATRSFRTDVLPLFAKYGCLSCHGGSGGLVVGNVAALLKGGDHGPALVPGNAFASLLMLKLGSPPPFGDRMPQGGSAMPSESMRIISDWIAQGGKEN